VFFAHLPVSESVFDAKGGSVKQGYTRAAARDLSLRSERERHVHSPVFETVAGKKPSTPEMFFRIRGIRKLHERFFINAQIWFGRVLREKEVLTEADS
jgi:hypothetical protein